MIYNSLGQQVQETSMNNTPYIRIPLSDFSSGVYFIRLRTSDGDVTQKVIVVK
jgi:hypothetical protein